ncbi:MULTISPECIES: cupin-like domain-containing protein [Sorangium]|uniref:cupin-like domain-containing protein n=1 Tax=Sorangium TaxID=39643 RepID=UPI003D9C5E6E
MTADKVGRIRLRDYLRSLDATTLYGDPLDASDFPTISTYYEVPKYVPMPRQLTIALWVGPSGTISHFHKDYYYEIPFLRNENCFVQICAKKQFVLVPPAYDDCMSVAGSDNTNVKSEILLNPEVTAQDIEEFGGMAQVMHACSMLPTGFRQMVTALVGGMR